MTSSASLRSQVFISYSHQDKRWLKRLQLHLKPGEREGLIECWDDTRIKPGTLWREEIKQAIASAKVAVLLVSADFLASEFIATNELPPLLATAQQSGMTILPVIVGRCGYADSKLAPFQAVNSPDKPLSAISRDKSEEYLVQLAERIKSALTNDHKDANDHKDPKVLGLFGYFFIEEDGKEKILVERENRFPITTIFNSNNRTVEEAINQVVEESFQKIGIDAQIFQNAGFFRVVYYQLYEILTTPNNSGRGKRIARQIPYVFFKIRLNKQFRCLGLNYIWKLKSESSRVWEITKVNRTEVQWITDSLDSINNAYMGIFQHKDLFEVITGDQFSEEFGFKVLECVDTLIFRKDKNGEIRFLMLYRKSTEKGWEYPKGGLYYHETYLEGALREIKEETDISSDELKYCAYLDMQTINVAERKDYYNTLRVHGLTFYYTGDPSTIHLNPEHTKHQWMTLTEAKTRVWMKNYGPAFFDRWSNQQQEILNVAEIHGNI